MANRINMTLDEIIGSNRNVGGRRAGGGTRAGTGGGGGRRAGGSRNPPIFRSGSPSGKWKHDKFGELYGPKRRGVGSTAGPRRRGGDDIVKLNISNLPETVVTSDLEELFQDFGIFGVSVHYNEVGQHLGTADLYADIGSAKSIMREYANIAIDGQELKFAVVDESGNIPGSRAPIAERIRRLNRRSDPIRRRKESPKKRTPVRRVVKGKGASAGAKKPVEKKKAMTSEELDKQLESYMGSRHPQIQPAE